MSKAEKAPTANRRQLLAAASAASAVMIVSGITTTQAASMVTPELSALWEKFQCQLAHLDRLQQISLDLSTKALSLRPRVPEKIVFRPYKVIDLTRKDDEGDWVTEVVYPRDLPRGWSRSYQNPAHGEDLIIADAKWFEHLQDDDGLKTLKEFLAGIKAADADSGLKQAEEAADALYDVFYETEQAVLDFETRTLGDVLILARFARYQIDRRAEDDDLSEKLAAAILRLVAHEA